MRRAFHEKSENRESKSKNSPYKVKINSAFSKNRMKVNIAGLEEVEEKLWEMIYLSVQHTLFSLY